jgi:hypothetical protein
MNLSIKQPKQSFASVLLAFSLFGFTWQHNVNSANGRNDVNLVKSSDVQQNDDSRYTPPRSPGFHDDFGS